MSPRKPNGAATAASTEVDAASEDKLIRCLQFGEELFLRYASNRPTPTVHELPLTRYGDYLHHFGFSLARELPMRLSADPLVQSKPGPPPTTVPPFPAGVEEDAVKGTTRLPPLPHPSPSSSSSSVNAAARAGYALDDADLSDDAGYGIAPLEQEEADAHAREVGPCGQTAEISDLAQILSGPFQRQTWRQTRVQCAAKIARCTFTWLCTHMTAVMEAPPSGNGQDAAASPDGAESAAATATSAKAKKGSTAASEKKRSVRGAAPSQQRAAADTAEEEPPPPPLDPATAALRTRVATPHTMALLYRQLLQQAQVSAEVVDGWLKGPSPDEAVEWYWNVVQVGEKSFLVDVASAIYDGPLRQSKRADGTTLPGNASATTAATAANAAAGGQKKEKKTGASAAAAAAAAASVAAAAQPTDEDGDELPSRPPLSLVNGPVLLPRQPLDHSVRVTHGFYFFAHPAHFLHTHFSRDERHALLRLPPNRTMWEVAPRLAHDFFATSVQLVSHRRNQSFSVRSSPFYVTVRNTDPATTELCAMLFRGTLRDLPEDLSLATPLGPQWVWHQRQETTAQETFTLMVPEAGLYVVLLAKRRVRADPYGAQICPSDDRFTPIARYEVKVAFELHGTAVLPRQHISPCLCRLLAPQTAQLLAGTHRFVVMPTCSNITAVAVVVSSAAATQPTASPLSASSPEEVRGGKKTAPNGGGGGGTAPVKARISSTPPPPTAMTSTGGTSARGDRRELLQFLPYNTERVVFEGDVALRAGQQVELWVLYAAPDHNGRSFEDRVCVEQRQRQLKAVAAAAAAAASAQASLPSGGGGRVPTAAGGNRVAKGGSKAKKDGVDVAQEEREAELRRLSLLQAQGQLFLPFITQVEVKVFLSRETADLMRPVLSVEEERVATLRRLAGVTPQLFQEATEVQAHRPVEVGTFFEATTHPAATVSAP